jgi:hypothetical protein
VTLARTLARPSMLRENFPVLRVTGRRASWRGTQPAYEVVVAGFFSRWSFAFSSSTFACASSRFFS